MQSSKLFAGKIKRFIQNIVKAEEKKGAGGGDTLLQYYNYIR